MALTSMEARQAAPQEKQYKLPDERGLYLLVMPTGAKYWRFRYSFRGKENMLGLGVFPDVGLKEARLKRDEARLRLAQGEDPRTERRRGQTFREVAQDWLRNVMEGHRSERHLESVRSRLDRFLLPKLGDVPIREIGPTDVLAVLRALQQGGILETAHRVKQVAGQVFRYAVSIGAADRDPTADLRGALPTRRGRHHGAARAEEEARAVMRAIAARKGGIVQMALRFSAYTFARPGEVRHAEWAEIDWRRAEWRIPGEKMKMRAEHVVPLARQTLALLRQMQGLTGHGRYVFPSIRALARGDRPMSENSVNVALRDMGFGKDEMTAHGFRAMASTLLNEHGFRPDAIERQLAHAERDRVRAAYDRAEHLDERRRMMQWWADFLDGLSEGDGGP
ncbi:MAG: integrase arm-type DNA-binding domain-containing protein [Synergistaceae bacterium]|nr:integrase arm-type DNA-binding domain-containing protein [Synergistaceae bacterium]